MSADSAATLENVELTEEEYIVPRGTCTVVWLMRVRDAWVPVREVAGATTTRLDAGVGCVFRRLVQLTVPRDTRMLRVESRPAIQHQSPIDYLSRGPARRRSQKKTEFRVGKSGELVRG
jgi:hypothetical protein